MNFVFDAKSHARRAGTTYINVYDSHARRSLMPSTPKGRPVDPGAAATALQYKLPLVLGAAPTVS